MEKTPVENGGIGRVKFHWLQILQNKFQKIMMFYLVDSVASRGSFLIDEDGTD